MGVYEETETDCCRLVAPEGPTAWTEQENADELAHYRRTNAALRGRLAELATDVNGIRVAPYTAAPTDWTSSFSTPVADRKLSFDADPFAIWAPTDAQGLTAPPHTRTKFFRENLLLNDVLASECCAAPIYDAVVPSTPGRILDKRLVDAYLGRNISSEVEGGQFRRTTGCAELSYDADTRSWWRELPDGGTFAFAPDHFLRNFKDDWQSMQASEGLKFSVDPPALAHFVGAGAASTAGNIYKTEYMQGFGFWNYSVDAKAHQVWASGEGRQKGGPARDFNGMRSGKDLYFSLAFHGPRARRYLLLELAALAG